MRSDDGGQKYEVGKNLKFKIYCLIVLQKLNIIFPSVADEHNIKIFTTADIEKYHKGLLSPKERHAIEKAALDDPFLADALEGYSSAINVNEDITELKERLAEKTEKTKVIPVLRSKASSFSWWKVAALIILIAGAGLLVYQLSLTNYSREKDIVQTSEKSVQNSSANPADDRSSLKKIDSNTNSNYVMPSQNDKKAKSSIKAYDSISFISTETAQSTIAAKEISDTIIKADDEKNVAAANEPLGDVTLQKARAARKMSVPPNAPVISKKEEFKTTIPADADGDGINDLFDKSEAKSKEYNANVKNQSPRFAFKTNIFRGRVTDTHNNPLPFTNITNLEDKVGTYTDARGYFTLTSPDSTLNVQVRSLGFETNNVQIVNTKPENKILLDEDKSLSARVLDTVKRNTNRSRTASMILEEPEPLDGWSNYDTYLVNNLKVPESFRKKEGGGEVELSFEVNKNGEPINITVKKSLCESCDKEAIRLIKEGPKWKQKKKKGKTTVTVTF